MSAALNEGHWEGRPDTPAGHPPTPIFTCGLLMASYQSCSLGYPLPDDLSVAATSVFCSPGTPGNFKLLREGLTFANTTCSICQDF